MTEDSFASIFDDPRHLLDDTEVDLEITKRKDRWHVNFDGDCYSIRTNNHKTQYAPLSITCRKNEGDWLLSEDPLWWHFEPDCKTTSSTPSPDTWGRLEFIRALSSWPVEDVGDPLLTSFISGHYKGIALWLLHRELKPSEKKKKLQTLLWTTPLVNLKPHADFCSAKREFTYQLSPKIELAQRAGDEELLWLILEYSTCLQKNQSEWASKTPLRGFCAQSINDYQQALRKDGLEEVVTIEQLQRDGMDWRRHVLTLLIQNAINQAFEDQDEDLLHHCNLFLDAWERYNIITGHSETDQIYFHDSNGNLRVSRKGHKKGKRLSPLMLASLLPE